MTIPPVQSGEPEGVTIPVLHPITARVTLPAEFALREAWTNLKAAERLADRAFGDMVQAAVRVNPSVLREPSVSGWVETWIEEHP